MSDANVGASAINMHGAAQFTGRAVYAEGNQKTMNAKGLPISVKLMIAAIVGVIVGVIVYLIVCISRHRRYFRSNQIDLEKGNVASNRIIRAWHDLGPGDFVLTTRRPVSETPKESLAHPGKTFVSRLTGILDNNEFGSHIALVLTRDASNLENPITLLNLKDRHTDIAILSLEEFLEQYPPDLYQMSVYGLNRWLNDDSVKHIQDVALKTDATYATSSITRQIIPRHDRGGIVKRIFGTPRWMGLENDSFTCSSLVYAAYEHAGFVVPYYNTQNDDKESESDTEWHPTQIIPADYPCKTFQWINGVRVIARVDDAHRLLRQ